MKLYIRVKDGKPFEHPILEDNFCQAFPGIDINNLPAGFAKFVRIPPPVIGPYEIYEGVSYELIDGSYTDVHSVTKMTPEQIKQKQDKTKATWAANSKFLSWVFNESICDFQPPVPYPSDGKNYQWDESTISWKLFE